MAKLTLVWTPIGNLGDMSPRARAALEEADFIAAEDTRVTLKLLNHFGIKKPMVSYHDYKMREQGERILSRIQNGENCAIVTDAGMPCISDPGEDIVRLCRDAGVEVTAAPGPTAALSALAVSGLPTGRFAFEGFLSVRKSSRMERLEEVKNDPRTLIFYEAPHKLKGTLEDMIRVFGGDRPISLVRELTKLHEEVMRTTLAGAAEAYTDREPRGEYVLIIGGAEKGAGADPGMTPEQAARMALDMAADGMALSEAARNAASAAGCKKGDIYRLALQLRDAEEGGGED